MTRRRAVDYAASTRHAESHWSTRWNSSCQTYASGEPTAALDSSRAQQVMELLAKIAHEHNAGVVVVTHDHRFLNVFDTIYAMEDGVLQEQNASAMLATT